MWRLQFQRSVRARSDPPKPFRLQVSSRMAIRLGYFDLAACNRSQVPSVEPPSTTMTSGRSVCCASVDTNPSMSSTSFRTVAVTVTLGMPANILSVCYPDGTEQACLRPSACSRSDQQLPLHFVPFSRTTGRFFP